MSLAWGIALTLKPTMKPLHVLANTTSLSVIAPTPLKIISASTSFVESFFNEESIASAEPCTSVFTITDNFDISPS